MNNESIVRSVTIAVIAGIIGLVSYALGSMYIKNNAVDACMKQSIVQWKNDGQSGYNFAPEWFQNCLVKKGI